VNGLNSAPRCAEKFPKLNPPSFAQAIRSGARLLPPTLRKCDGAGTEHDSNNYEGEHLYRTQLLKILGIPAIQEFNHALISREALIARNLTH
jgi:hypothetical protein